MDYKKIIFIIVILLVGLASAILLLRGNGNEDAWICENGQWVSRGNPAGAMPSQGCGEAVYCTQDAKLCTDGSYVGRIPPECDFALCPKEDLIILDSPQAESEIRSPLLLSGQARGFWFFEASFPVRLYDGNGQLLATAIATAQNEWMTEDFVPFLAELEFGPPETENGTLVLEKDNPSGLPENADELRVPVSFHRENRTINLYYYNSELDKDESGNVKCSRDGLVAVERQIPQSITPIQDAIKLLLSGPLPEEKETMDITTEYPLAGFSLLGASLEDRVLTLEFADPENKAVGGACRVGVLWFQIEATAQQFDEVDEVRFLPEEIFQP